MKAFAAGDINVRPLAALLNADEEQLLEELATPRFTAAQADGPEQAYAL